MSGVGSGSAAGGRWLARALGCLCPLASLLASTAVLTRAQAPSSDRIVAEWMLRMGGSVVLEGERRPIGQAVEQLQEAAKSSDPEVARLAAEALAAAGRTLSPAHGGASL